MILTAYNNQHHVPHSSYVHILQRHLPQFDPTRKPEEKTEYYIKQLLMVNLTPTNTTINTEQTENTVPYQIFFPMFPYFLPENPLYQLITPTINTRGIIGKEINFYQSIAQTLNYNIPIINEEILPLIECVLNNFIENNDNTITPIITVEKSDNVTVELKSGLSIIVTPDDIWGSKNYSQHPICFAGPTFTHGKNKLVKVNKFCDSIKKFSEQKLRCH